MSPDIEGLVMAVSSFWLLAIAGGCVLPWLLVSE
jgi:hypothetical protein